MCHPTFYSAFLQTIPRLYINNYICYIKEIDPVSY